MIIQMTLPAAQGLVFSKLIRIFEKFCYNDKTYAEGALGFVRNSSFGSLTWFLSLDKEDLENFVLEHYELILCCSYSKNVDLVNNNIKLAMLNRGHFDYIYAYCGKK